LVLAHACNISRADQNQLRQRARRAHRLGQRRAL